MERTAFTLLHEAERSWWYRGRAAVIRAALTRVRIPPGRVLDFGAGYGGMHSTFAEYGEVEAFEPDEIARANAKERGYKRVYDTVTAALQNRYDLIALCDVLEHIKDDAEFLRDARAALTEEGKLLLTVPAMPFLWSAHDVNHHHYRRYSRKALHKVLRENGFRVCYMSFWNMFLFPPAAFARLTNRGGESSLRLPSGIDALFYTLVHIEAFFIRFISLPFGVSLVVLAEPV